MDYYEILYYATPFIFTGIAVLFFVVLRDHLKKHKEQ